MLSIAKKNVKQKQIIYSIAYDLLIKIITTNRRHSLLPFTVKKLVQIRKNEIRNSLFYPVNKKRISKIISYLAFSPLSLSEAKIPSTKSPLFNPGGMK